MYASEKLVYNQKIIQWQFLNKILKTNECPQNFNRKLAGL